MIYGVVMELSPPVEQFKIVNMASNMALAKARMQVASERIEKVVSRRKLEGKGEEERIEKGC